MAGMDGYNHRSQRVFILLAALLLTMHIFTPFAAASGGMDSCDGGFCDDYDPNHDLTQNQEDWINATYDFKLVDTNTIELDIVWAIHEFDRSKLDFNTQVCLLYTSDAADDL